MALNRKPPGTVTPANLSNAMNATVPMDEMVSATGNVRTRSAHITARSVSTAARFSQANTKTHRQNAHQHTLIPITTRGGTRMSTNVLVNGGPAQQLLIGRRWRPVRST